MCSNAYAEQKVFNNLEVTGTINSIGYNLNGAPLALTGLSDVNSATATANHFLVADGTDWESIYPATLLAGPETSGVMTLGGTGGSNNENITIDTETNANWVTLDSGTSAKMSYGVEQHIHGNENLTFRTGGVVIGNQALLFDAESENVTISGSESIAVYGSTAYSATIKVNLLSLGGGSAGRLISTAGATAFELRTSGISGNLYGLYAKIDFGGGTDAIAITPNNVLTFETEHIITVVFNEDSANKIKIYVDEDLITLGTDTAGVGTIDNDTTDNKVIGNNSSSNRNTDGQILDVTIYRNTALSQAEVITLNQGGSVSGATAHWDFSDGTGSTLTDIVGSNDGTISGATWVVDGSRAATTLKWDNTDAKDSFQVGLLTGDNDYTGYMSVVELDDMGNANRSPASFSTNPVLRVYSSDVTNANDYIEMYHDQTDAYIVNGAGDITLNPEGIVNIIKAGSPNLKILNTNTAATNRSNLSILAEDERRLYFCAETGHKLSSIQSIGHDLYFVAGYNAEGISNTRMFINGTSSNVGIGTTAPVGKLDVTGDMVIYEAGDEGANRTARGGTDNALRIYSDDGTNADDYIESFHDQTDANIAWGTGALNLNSGEIEIGNTTNADSTIGVITKGGSPFIHDFEYGNNGTVTPDGNNVFVGSGAGNLTMGSTATLVTESSYNIALGYNSLQSNTTGAKNSGIGDLTLFDNTSGYNNTAIGSLALTNNTSGNNNSAIGSRALTTNTTGINNVAIGQQALTTNNGSNNNSLGYRSLYANTTGVSNIGMGRESLYGNTTGNFNVGLGQYAGKFITDGSTARQLGSYNVFVGYNTKALASADDNEVVIGYNATGIGSNTVTLGADTITTTALKGNVGIGTTAPGADLNVMGSVAIGTTEPSGGFSGDGDIYATSGIKAMEGLYSEAVAYGAALEVANNALAITYTNAAYGTATLTAATQVIYDPEADFGGDDDIEEGMYLKVITATVGGTPGAFVGATGEIISVTDGTNLVVSFATAGTDSISDATAMSYVIYPEPIFFVGDNGDIHSHVGVNEDASFKVYAEDSNNSHAAHLVVTAGVDGNAALEIEYDADTYSDTSAIEVGYDITGFNHVDEMGTILDVIIDNVGATAGDMHVIDVALSDTSNTNVEIEAVATHEGVDVIAQYLGDAAALDTAWSYDTDTYNDRTTAFNASGTNVQIFSSDNDFILLGSTAKWDEINVLNAINSSRKINPIFEYIEDDGDWVVFTPGDDTNGFRRNGTIRFESDNLTTWGQRTVNEVTGETGATDYYWIKITRTRNNVPTPPTESTIQVTTLGAKHHWDKEGNVDTKTIAVTDGITAPSNISGQAIIYVDTADGDLKVKFGDGTVTTIATD